MMRRVPDVLDVWFDSGSMSFAQVHYPFENAEWFEHHFPGDFIVEYIGQTRGWFYTLHILATAIFDRPAFSTCVSHGIVLGSDGNKMSKSLRNYPDVYEVFDRDGADAMRWFLMSSPILRGGNLIVTEQGIRDSVRQVLIPLWNSWYFFALYANAAGRDAASRSTDSEDPLDRYLLAKCRQYVEAMTEQLDNYEVANACDSTRAFLDVLTNWYIRRSRERFWATAARSTRRRSTRSTRCSRRSAGVTAPLLPLTTEEVWRGLTGGRSVHLTDWPAADSLPADDALVSAMDQVREVCSATSALRKASSLRNRLPLSTLDVVVADPALAEGLRGDHRRRGQRQGGAAARRRLRRGRVVRRLPAAHRQRPRRRSAAGQGRAGGDPRARSPATGRSTTTARSRRAGWCSRRGSTPSRPWPAPRTPTPATGMLPGGGFVVLDTAVTPELAAEGLARDLVRAVQQARRDAGLDVSDRISLTISGFDRRAGRRPRPRGADRGRDARDDVHRGRPGGRRRPRRDRDRR